ncbi:hypothetical protein [Amycolatopsis sp. NPDC051372]|uniref:hypothetical protein n=1 Tax=unclassified Amycolatopsis TaxID=2618356 RepID=UPI003436D67B
MLIKASVECINVAPAMPSNARVTMSVPASGANAATIDRVAGISGPLPKGGFGRGSEPRSASGHGRFR